jgi:hypothetical protein
MNDNTNNNNNKYIENKRFSGKGRSQKQNQSMVLTNARSGEKIKNSMIESKII